MTVNFVASIPSDVSIIKPKRPWHLQAVPLPFGTHDSSINPQYSSLSRPIQSLKNNKGLIHILRLNLHKDNPPSRRWKAWSSARDTAFPLH